MSSLETADAARLAAAAAIDAPGTDEAQWQAARLLDLSLIHI